MEQENPVRAQAWASFAFHTGQRLGLMKFVVAAATAGFVGVIALSSGGASRWLIFSLGLFLTLLAVLSALLDWHLGMQARAGQATLKSPSGETSSVGTTIGDGSKKRRCDCGAGALLCGVYALVALEGVFLAGSPFLLSRVEPATKAAAAGPFPPTGATPPPTKPVMTPRPFANTPRFSPQNPPYSRPNGPGGAPPIPGGYPNFPGGQPNGPGGQPNGPGGQPNFPGQQFPPGQPTPGAQLPHPANPQFPAGQPNPPVFPQGAAGQPNPAPAPGVTGQPGAKPFTLANPLPPVPATTAMPAAIVPKATTPAPGGTGSAPSSPSPAGVH